MIPQFLPELLAAILAGAVFGLLRHVFASRRRSEAEPEEPSAPAPSGPRRFGPPITAAELAGLRSALGDHPLPALRLDPEPGSRPSLWTTRLGGAPWLARGASWPRDASGIPLEFLAQLDFANLPALPDFPTSGLLQFFVKRDDLYGANFDAPLTGEARVLWHPEPGEGRDFAPPPLTQSEERPFADFSPLMDAQVRERGLALTATPFDGLPDPLDRTIEARTATLAGRPGEEDVDTLLDAQAERALCHHIGGYPAFTQWDFRPALGADYTDYDRVLLRLTSDDTVMWGDSGEAVFMIRREDLLERDFSRVVFWWDCL